MSQKKGKNKIGMVRRWKKRPGKKNQRNNSWF